MVDVHPVDRPFGFAVPDENDLHRPDVNARRPQSTGDAPVTSRPVTEDPFASPGGASASGGHDARRYTPAWYPDPTRRFEFRYHNGQAWTGDVSVDGRRFLDPLPSMPEAWAVLRPMPPAGYVGAGTAARESIAPAMAALVLGICSVLVGWVPFLCVLSAIGAVVGLVLGINVLRRDAARRRLQGDVSRGHGYAVAGVVLAPIGLALTVVGVWLTVVVVREVNEFTDVGPQHTEVTSCDLSDGIARVRGTITNDSGSTHSYRLTIRFERGGRSARLGSAGVSVAHVASGETAEWTASEPLSTSVDEIDCVVSDVTGPVPFED